MQHHNISILIRDRPFNLQEGEGYGILFRSEIFFRTTQEFEHYLLLKREARNFSPEFNIRLYDKNSESDYFFFLHQNQNIFFSNIGNQNIFLEKNHNPHIPARLMVNLKYTLKLFFVKDPIRKKLEGFHGLSFIDNCQHLIKCHKNFI
jgi:hypothetical protein